MATLQDIAVAVGVTPTTVANALKGRGNVSEATRKRILKCAEELKYRPNMLARSLAQGKTCTLGFLLPTIANPFYPEIAEASGKADHELNAARGRLHSAALASGASPDSG